MTNKTFFCKIVFIMFCVILFAFEISSCQAGNDNYLIGIFGVPEGDWNILRKVGVNSLLVRENEIKKTRDLSQNKIYVLGIKPKVIKQGIDEVDLARRMNNFRSLNDAYGYFVAGDVKCKTKPLVGKIINKFNITQNPMVGLLKGDDIGCYTSDYDTFFYYYPLMRRGLSLSEMLKQQVATIKKAKRRCFPYVQTHQMFWYKTIIKLSKARVAHTTIQTDRYAE